MHLGRVSIALSRFLKEDLSPTYLGLTDGARQHLDRFRRFLHSFYVEKFGYWPPPRGVSFPKALYKSMYYDFQTLYDYLVDTESSTGFASQKPASGGLCVLQNVDNFDKRHNFKAQPHPLPLLPTCVPSKIMDSQKALRQLTLATQHKKSHNLHSITAALAEATNTLDRDVSSSKIVQAYMDFERSHAMQREEKISAVDARKVRWLLIYGTLQYLVSALRAPKEVRDSESCDYPLCCMPEKSSWGGGSQEATPMATPSNVPQAVDGYFPEQHSPSYSIQPDCHREDYFTSKTPSRRGSVEVPAPLKVAIPIRQSSLRSFGPRSLSVRSSRRNSVTLKPAQHCAILIHGYGDGLNSPTSPQDNPRPTSSIYSEQTLASILPDGAGPDSSWLRSATPSAPASASHSRKPSADLGPRTPTLDSFQLDDTFDMMTPRVISDAPSRSDSTGSTASSVWSEGASIASSKTSTDGEPHSPYKASTVESSGLLGGLVPVGNTVIGLSRTQSLTQGAIAIPQSHIHPLLRKPSPPRDFDFSFDKQCLSTSAVPSSDSGPTIGIAVSASPSPPISDTPRTITRSDAAALVSDNKKPYLPPAGTLSPCIESAPATPSASTVKSPTSYVFPDLNSPSSEVWQHYKTSLTRRHSPSSTGSGSGSSGSGSATPPPISKTATAHGLKVPSFRLASKLRSEGDAVKKEGRRLSSLWRW